MVAFFRLVLVDIIWRGLSIAATATLDWFKKRKKEKETQQQAKEYEGAPDKDSSRDTFGRMP